MVGTLSQGDAGASPPSAGVRLLYRHALESIFAFCSVTELASVLRVSKDWAAAVQSMRPLDGQVGYMQSDLLQHLCASRLARHVGSLFCSMWPIGAPAPPLSDTALVEVAQRMVNLRRLAWKSSVIADTVAVLESRFVFPVRLRHFGLQVVPANKEAPPSASSWSRALNAAIEAIASLAELESLALTAEDARSCDLTPLLRAPALRDLTLVLNQDVLESPTVVETLRCMPHLRSLSFEPSALGFARMLQTPHKMKLDTLNLSLLPLTAEHGDAIKQLSTLTDLRFVLNSEHTDFFQQLPNLHSLQMHGGQSTVLPDAARIMQSLHSLTGLTELGLGGKVREEMPHHFHFTSNHLAACLPHMPLLTKLLLMGASALNSLRFLSSGPITQSLQELDLGSFTVRLPPSELTHVHALSSLTKLTLRSVFDPPPDESTLALYAPPSRLMPSLQSFWHHSVH
jgi:hypothetical protein